MMIEKSLRWIVLSGIFALPFIVFIVAQTLFFPFITGKNFAFRIIVEIITGAWLALALANPAYRPKRSWLLGAFAVFVLIIALADALGVYPFKSFWSNFERMDGWVTQAHLFAYFVVAFSVLTTEKLWQRLWQMSFGISGLVGLYGFLQAAGIASVNAGFSSVARIDATFGNPIYLAVYMLFHIFIGALLWSQAWEEKRPGKRLPLSLLYGGMIAIDTMVLLFTGTRGTMLGLIGGALLAVLIWAFASRSSTARRAAVASLIAVVVFGGGLLLLRDSALLHNVGFLQRIASISLQDNTVKARFMNWGMAWEGAKERPILGWGQENYAIVFDKYYNPKMYGQEQWFDRVHNVVFDWLIAGGFLGLLSYLSLLACALWCIWKTTAFKVAERSILTGLLAAYFFHNLFVFDNITSYVLFVSVLAYIASRARAASNAAPLISASWAFPRALPIIAALAVMLVWGSAWFVNGRALAQNRALLQAVAPQSEGPAKNLEYFKKSISYGTYGTQEAREQLVQGTAQIAGTDSISTDIKKNFFDTAASEMMLQAQSSPLDARFPLFLGVLLDAYGDYQNALTALTRAHELSPGKQSILYELASNQFARGDTTGALATFKLAYELAPENTDAHIYYAAAAIRIGQDKLADELLAPLIASDVAADVRIAAAYVARGKYDAIAKIWEAHLKAQPQDAQGYFTLAAAYYGAGNRVRAISVLETAKSVIPSVQEQADALIKEIRDGTAKI